jgi:hypothetical protein
MNHHDGGQQTAYIDIKVLFVRLCLHKRQVHVCLFSAMVYGQGNVRTFDDERYFVCGEGDFILLKSSAVTIEGRFQKSSFNRKYLQIGKFFP